MPDRCGLPSFFRHDGRRIDVQSDRGGTPQLTHMKCQTDHRLTGSALVMADTNHPCGSPRGDKIAFVAPEIAANSRLRVMDRTAAAADSTQTIIGRYAELARQWPGHLVLHRNARNEIHAQ